ncbi:MAG TPA: hypothetical protein VLU91_05390 [Nitrososphaerales archaeon]|nr:hypothetical protein [Nitrososphaerales archaeon]
MSLPRGQPRFWVESRSTADNTNGVWHRAGTVEDARRLRESLTEAGNKCVIIYEWIGLRYAAVEGAEKGVQTMVPPFWEGYLDSDEK